MLGESFESGSLDGYDIHENRFTVETQQIGDLKNFVAHGQPQFSGLITRGFGRLEANELNLGGDLSPVVANDMKKVVEQSVVVMLRYECI